MRFTVRRAAWLLAVTALVVLAFRVAPVGQAPDYARAHYTKYEYEIPMRDGKKLFTSVYVPKDTSQPYQIGRAHV